MIKRICFILVCSLTLIVFSCNMNIFQVNASSNSPMSVIHTLSNYLNTEKWHSIPSLWVSDMENTLSPFFNDTENRNNKVGLFNIKKAKILDWKELSFEQVSSFTYIKEDARYFYISIDNEVFMEDKYHMNGINYYLAALVEENGNWRIAQFSTAPVDIFVSNKIGFGTEDEFNTASNFEKRKKGLFLNKKGEVLKKNKATDIEKNKEKSNYSTDQKEKITSTLATNDHNPPSEIVVYISNSHNVNYYGCSGCRKMPDFDYYVKNVLPNEWYSTWHMESLKAGALAVKMYGWYAAYYPLASPVGADVYDDTKSQVYKVGTSVTRTNQAVNDTSNKGLHRGDNHNLFLTEYRAGSYASGGKSGGLLWQNGSKYWADNGYNHVYILNHYYDGSSKVGGAGKYYYFFYY